jgi:hypothetical protein
LPVETSIASLDKVFVHKYDEEAYSGVATKIFDIKTSLGEVSRTSDYDVYEYVVEQDLARLEPF